MKQKCYVNYPFSMIIISGIVSFLTYFIGAFIFFRIGILWMLLYLLFAGFLEFRLLKGHCVNCYYYGKYCAFGRGKLSALLFRKGNPKGFAHLKITWKDMIPDFLVSLLPAAAGIVLLIMHFEWMLLSFVLLLFLLTFVGNPLVRNLIACRYCAQRNLGCPAEKLFSKANKPKRK